MKITFVPVALAALTMLAACPTSRSGECPPCECRCQEQSTTSNAPANPSTTAAATNTTAPLNADAGPPAPQSKAFMFLGIPHRIEQTKEYRDSCPLVPLESKVRINSASTSELSFNLKNQSSKTIDSFDFIATCFNNYDEKIYHRDLLRDLRFDGKSIADFEAVARRTGRDVERIGDFLGRSSTKLSPGQTRNVGDWSMFDHEGATQAIVTITKVHFTDNTLWEGEITQEVDPR